LCLQWPVSFEIISSLFPHSFMLQQCLIHSISFVRLKHSSRNFIRILVWSILNQRLQVFIPQQQLCSKTCIGVMIRRMYRHPNHNDLAVTHLGVFQREVNKLLRMLGVAVRPPRKYLVTCWCTGSSNLMRSNSIKEGEQGA